MSLNRPADLARRLGRRCGLAAVLLCLGLLLLLMASRDTGAGDRFVAGHLLVASESMGDPRFRQSVIYMIDHSDTGALGLIVNRPVAKVPIAAALKGLGLEAEQAEGEIPIYQGGPVEPGRGFLLHSTDIEASNSRPLGAGIALGAPAEILRLIGRGEGPRHSLLAFGYAGWGPGQLDGELARADWFVIPAEIDLVFADDPRQSWRQAMTRRGIDL